MDRHGIVIADATGVIRHWSAGAENLFGHAASRAIGTRLDLMIPEQYRADHWHGFTKAMETGAADVDGTTTDFPVLCGHGGVEVFNAAVTLVRDPQRRVIGAMVVFAPNEHSAA